MSTPLSASATASRAAPWLAIGLAVFAVLATGSAQAQSASGTLSSYRAGYGGIGVTGLESPVSPSPISTSSQFAISDGVNQAGSVGSVFTTQSSTGQASSSPTSGGAGQSYTGVGQGSVSNARAPLAVVDSTTANTASAHSATTNGTAPSDTVLNGKLNLDGGQ